MSHDERSAIINKYLAQFGTSIEDLEISEKTFSD
jgi:hypothetical protein